MVQIRDQFVTPDLGKGNPPAASCKSGEMVVFHTRDCYNNRLDRNGREIPGATQMANPATGPLFVEGAMPGDILKVEVLDIKTADFALMRGRPGIGAFGEYISELTVQSFDLSAEKIPFFGQELDFDVMIGVIGTAAKDAPVDTDTPGEHGGNMDCKKIVKGSVLYLPVFHEGALLSMGDLHARMGDGEVLICGLECSGEVSVRVSVLKDTQLPTPFLYCRGRVMTIQSDKTLDLATKRCTDSMHAFLKQACKLSDFEAGAVLSILGDLAICQIVDPLLTVRMELDLDTLLAHGWRLP